MEIKNGGTYVNKGTGAKCTVYAVATDLPTQVEKVVFLTHKSEAPYTIDKKAFKTLFMEVNDIK